MDIRSGLAYPSAALSNFAPHSFVLDGVECASMEGLLQSLKFESPESQAKVCKLVGMQAKMSGKPRNYAWQQSQTLWWNGVPMQRKSVEYQQFLERAYCAMLEQSGSFRRALIASGNSVLRHSIGWNKEEQTVLTEREFCALLTRMREKAREMTESEPKTTAVNRNQTSVTVPDKSATQAASRGRRWRLPGIST